MRVKPGESERMRQDHSPFVTKVGTKARESASEPRMPATLAQPATVCNYVKMEKRRVARNSDETILATGNKILLSLFFSRESEIMSTCCRANDTSETATLTKFCAC